MGASGETQTVSSTVDPIFASRLGGLYNDARSYLNQNQYTPYPYQQIAGQQPWTQAAQGYLGHALGIGNPGFAPPQTGGPYQGQPWRFGGADASDPTVPENPYTPPGPPTDPGNPGDEGDSPGDWPGYQMYTGPMVNATWDPYTPGPGENPTTPPPTYPTDPTNQTSFSAQPWDPSIYQYGQAGAPNQPYTYTPGQSDQAVGMPQTNEAVDRTRQVATYGPQQVQGGSFLGGNLPQYQNMYNDQVVNAALGDIDRSRQLAQQDNNSMATMAGAFGDSRAGIQAAETNRNYGDIAARTAAQLRSQGFDTAAGLYGQDLNRGLQAGMSNQGAGLQGAALRGQAAGQLGQLGGQLQGMTFGNAQMMNQMGLQNQGLAQQMTDADLQQFYEARNDPLRGFGLLQGILSGMPVGMSQTTYQPTHRGQGFAQGALGGAATGASIGSVVPGLGTGLGAGLGGLLGGLGGWFG